MTGGVDDGDLIGFNLSKLDPQSWTQRTQVRPISVVISPCLLRKFLTEITLFVIVDSTLLSDP